jgi:CDP-glycerol glycerophosphotransferase (TagB/SpsB family)
MRDEARRHHHYGAQDVVVTGAPHHDMIFSDRQQLADRATFFGRFGLDPSKKLITYAGEDPIIAPDAPMYAEQIERAIREGRLSQPAQLLVRPHPQDDPRRWDRVRQLPGVCFDLPGRQTEHWMDMSREDLRRLYETMWHSDVIVNVTSTIVLDAAFFDTPTICVGYGYSHAKTYYNSPMRFFEMDHYRYILDAGATRVVASESELLGAIDEYLTKPSKELAGRRRIVREISQFEDGRSAERTAGAIIAAARLATRAAEARSTAEIPATGRAI